MAKSSDTLDSNSKFVFVEDDGSKDATKLKRQHVMKYLKQQKQNRLRSPPTRRLLAKIESSSSDSVWSHDLNQNPPTELIYHSTKNGSWQVVSQSKGGYKISPTSWSSMSSKIMAQTLRHLPAPDLFKMSEEMFQVLSSHLACQISPRLLIETPQLHGSLSMQRRKLLTPTCLIDCVTSFTTAVEMLATPELSKGKIGQATASLEQAFQQIEDIVRTDHWSMTLLLVQTVVWAYAYGVPELGSMLLRQLRLMALTINGTDHPHAKWTRDLLQLLEYDAPTVLETILLSLLDTVDLVIGPTDEYSTIMRSSVFNSLFKLRGGYIGGLADIYAKSVAMINSNDPNASKNYLGYHTAIRSSYASALISIGQYETALTVLDGFQSILDQAIHDGQEKSSALLLDSLTTLGVAHDGLGQHAEAEAVWTRVIQVSTEFHGKDHPITIQAIVTFGNSLAKRRLDRDAQILFSAVDERLSAYMLRPEDETP